MGDAILRAGNPGRSGHALSIRSARDLFAARERLAELFGCADSSRFVFTENATVALNQAIKGVLRPGDHVVTTSVEHNSVMRPLRRMEEAGVRVTVVPAGEDGVTEARDVIAAFRKATRLVVIVHASNVSGALQPVDAVVAAARRRGILTLIDAAQTAGSLPIDLSSLPVDLLAASGHKGLLGPQGTGFLFVREGVPIVPLIEGGTGSRSESDHQPEFFPDALESGTRNSVGAAGLAVSLAWILRKGVGTIRRREVALVDLLLHGLSRMPGVTVYGPADPARRGSAVSFRVEGMDPADVGARLEKRSGRAGAGGAALLPERSPRPRDLPRRDRAREPGPLHDARGDRDVPVRPPEDPGPFRLRSAARARIEVVERPGRNRIVFTAPPCARTTSDPTISFPFQSPPLTRTCGHHVADQPRGVSSGKIAT